MIYGKKIRFRVPGKKKKSSENDQLTGHFQSFFFQSFFPTEFYFAGVSNKDCLGQNFFINPPTFFCCFFFCFFFVFFFSFLFLISPEKPSKSSKVNTNSLY